MGIDVSAAKAVSVNVTHEEGVDTSLENNPTVSRFEGMFLLHVFRRNQRGRRRDDGNPLIYGIKGLNSYSITVFWEQWLLRRAVAIIASAHPSLHDFNMCVPVPSSSAFCGKFAALVADQLGIPLLVPDFIGKRTIGGVMNDAIANPPKMRPGQKVEFNKQLQVWQAAANPDATYQAKHIPTGIRTLFTSLEVTADAPDLTDDKILIVDDLFATGSSLLTMRALLSGLNAKDVGALCFLSGNNG